MRIDEEILDLAIFTQSQIPTLRLYGWDIPTLSIGKNQKIEDINTKLCEKFNIPIVKRPTGGRSLLHDRELTYSFVCSEKYLTNGSSVTESYKEISNIFVEVFKNLDIELEYPMIKKIAPNKGYCMSVSTGSDLSYQGKKFIGSAQLRRKGYILQHGSILLEINRELIKQLFNTDDIGNIISLKEINKNLNIKTLEKEVSTYISTYNQV